MRTLALLMALAACAPQGGDGPGQIVVVLRASQVTVSVDDVVAEAPTTPGMARPATARLIPGAFARARAVIATKGPAARAAARPGPEVCMDYGTDKVMITPALPEFDVLAADCPDPAVLALAEVVLAAVVP